MTYSTQSVAATRSDVADGQDAIDTALSQVSERVGKARVV